MKAIKIWSYVLLSVALSTNFVSCHDDDPDYSKVVPPEVAASNSISGCITSISGEGISGATIIMDGASAATTATDGTFTIEKVAAGSHQLKASAAGKIEKEETVTVTDSDKGSVVVWNAALASEGVTVSYNEDGVGEATVETETVKGNEEAKIETKVTVPENAVSDKSATITITPVYNDNDASALLKSTRANEESVLLTGTNVKCSNASATLTSSLTLIYTVDASIAESLVAKKLVNGSWVDVPFVVDGGKVSVTADSFTSYSLFLGASITKTPSSETLTFSPNHYDNLYGSGDLSVGSSSYSYKVGTEISSSGTTKLTAYLIEILARLTGASVRTLQGSYPINVVLSVGTALTISGTQSATTYTVSAFNRSVSGKKYGDVTVVTRAYNRQHTGSSN